MGVGGVSGELRQGRSGFRKHSIFLFFFLFFYFACDLCFLIKCEVFLLNVMVKLNARLR